MEYKADRRILTMNKTSRVIAVILMISIVFSFAACGKTDSGATEAATISSKWVFAKITREDWSTTKTELEAMNTAFPEKAFPVPEFTCEDGTNCTLQYAGKNHSGVIELKEDGSYSISNKGKVWGTATIVDNRLNLVLGDNVALLEFEVAQ